MARSAGISRDTELHRLINIGPRTARALTEVGIADAEALRRVGPVEARRRLKLAAPRETTLIGLYALYGALIDVHWNALPPEIKASLRAEAGTRR